MPSGKGISSKRKILFVTERRADYSRFKPIIDNIVKEPGLEYQLIVTGMHLLEKYGKTIDLIKEDGLDISSVIPMFKENSQDTGAGMVKAMGKFMRQIPRELERLKPDIVLTGFDIGANFATAVASAHMNIPTGHVQGGEVSGSIDESLRHATSKFAHFHFPATKDAAERLVRMGENPKYIFEVGCPSLDVLLNARDMSQKELEMELGTRLPAGRFIIIIQHTVTTEIAEVPRQIKETLDAVRELDVPAFILYPNNDAGAHVIIREINNTKIRRFRTFSIEVYANLLKRASALVGNSSSGIHETASFHVPTVNIGSRQQGRQKPDNVIDVPSEKNEIKKGIQKALSDKIFLKKVANCKNPYGDGRSAERIVKVLKGIRLDNELIKKRFVD